MGFQRIEVYPILDIDFLTKLHKKAEDEIRILKRYPISMLQIRWKSGTSGDFYKLAMRIRDLWEGKLIINDRVEIVLAINADGVHIGDDDLPPDVVKRLIGRKRSIGLSTHSIKEIKNAVNLPLTYIAFGAIFPTLTKGREVKVQGIERLRKAVKASTHPVFAIGGINHKNIMETLGAGVKGVAMISGIFKGDTERNLSLIFQKVERWKNSC